ncbi:MAG: HEAT repeat domain-containing protein, partial [Myxococcales bacterium]|nr:HEAT repeat domain-containing protein [Myxococcales bacterium]
LHRSESERPAAVLASPFGEPITDDDDDLEPLEPLEPEPEAPSSPGLQALSSPLGSGKPSTSDSARGRIQFEEEDRPTRPAGPMAEIDAAIADAMRGSSGAVERLRTLGDAAMRRIVKQFPGELDVVRRDLDTLPPLPAHGALIRLTLDLGSDLAPHLLAVADHPNPTVRFYVAFVFMELRYQQAVGVLGELAFDPDADVRAIAMRVLETYSGEPGFDNAVAVIRRELDSPNRTRQLHSTRAIGTVRDILAVPKLIDLLTSKERYIQEAALESLCSITGQQLGLKPHRWRSWYGDNAHHHRVEWIISSLAHKDLSVRRWASDELRRITGQRINFLAAGSKQEREIGIRKWVEWWNEQGRARFGG